MLMSLYNKYFLTHVTHMRNVRNERYAYALADMCLRRPDTLDTFSGIFYEGDNFCDALSQVAFLHTNFCDALFAFCTPSPFEKGSTLQSLSFLSRPL